MIFQYWYMFPVAILVATTAMASGIGGATFFTPIFILALRLPPEVAIGTGLITEVFGFTSGLYAYAHKRLINYKLGISLLIVTIPAALIGTWMSGSCSASHSVSCVHQNIKISSAWMILSKKIMGTKREIYARSQQQVKRFATKYATRIKGG